MLPLAVSDTGHWLGWIQSFPLRADQAGPVDFGLSSLYQSSLVTGGLLGAAIIAIVVALLFVGGPPQERAVRGWAALMAGIVLLVPLLLAVAGRDYYVPRNMIDAWLPLAVVLARGVHRAASPAAGGAFALVIIGGFLYAGIRIDNSPQYQRPNLRGVATALGHPVVRRAVVADDGDFAAQPLSVYLREPRWPPGPNAPTTVNEVDIVGGVWQTIPTHAAGRCAAHRTDAGRRLSRHAVRGSARLAGHTDGARARARGAAATGRRRRRESSFSRLAGA